LIGEAAGAHLAGPAAFGCGLNVAEPLRSGRQGIDVVLDAQDHYARRAAPANDKPFVFLDSSSPDLPELISRGKGRNNVCLDSTDLGSFLPESAALRWALPRTKVFRIPADKKPEGTYGHC
jgi:hypothetical protein